MRILVVGDPYLDASAFASGLGSLRDEHVVEFFDIDATEPAPPRSESERVLREYAGSPDAIIERMVGVEVLVVHGAPVSDAVLDASSVLRLVCCARGGPVNVDLGAASARGIPVATTPGKNAEAVAEQTIAFLIMLVRRFPKAQRFLSEGGTIGGSTFEGAEFFGGELGERVLGLVGFGHVGRAVARRARAFGMSIVVFDPYLSPADTDGIELADALDALLGRAHFVSLHARATSDNVNLIGAAELAAMRRGSFLVNTARETLIDEAALDLALSSGHLGGAALDVVRPTHEPGPHPLLRHDNVIITPHIGGATEETLHRGAAMLAAEIRRFAIGEPLRHVATRPATARER